MKVKGKVGGAPVHPRSLSFLHPLHHLHHTELITVDDSYWNMAPHPSASQQGEDIAGGEMLHIREDLSHGCIVPEDQVSDLLAW